MQRFIFLRLIGRRKQILLRADAPANDKRTARACKFGAWGIDLCTCFRKSFGLLHDALGGVLPNTDITPDRHFRKSIAGSVIARSEFEPRTVGLRCFARKRCNLFGKLWEIE